MAYTLLDEEKLCRVYQDTEKALDKTLAHIVQLLDGEHQTVATAESCTGGLLSQKITSCLLYTSPSPRDGLLSRMPSSA